MKLSLFESVLKGSMGFLGGLSGLLVWKQLQRAVLAKLKSMFLKGVLVSRVHLVRSGYLVRLNVAQKDHKPACEIRQLQ